MVQVKLIVPCGDGVLIRPILVTSLTKFFLNLFYGKFARKDK